MFNQGTNAEFCSSPAIAQNTCYKPFLSHDMNKTVNQDGEIIICVGQEGSHIRNKEVYNKTMARLLCRIRSVWSYGGVDRHCDPQDLWDIMEADDIPKDKWKSLYNSAYYYFDVECGVR